MPHHLLISLCLTSTAIAANGTVGIHGNADVNSTQAEKVRSRKPWNVNTFFNSIQVIDGNLNFWVLKDRNCVGTNCEKAVFPGDGSADLSGVKQLTGVDIGVLNVSSGQDTLTRIKSAIAKGRYANGNVVLSSRDLNKKNRYGVLFAVQKRVSPNWQLRGNPKQIRQWYKAGLRILQIQYGPSENHGPFERLGHGTSEGDDKGLTDLGKAVVKEMNAVGMIIDVAHSNRQTTLDVAGLSKSPIISTHSNAESLTPTTRNKSDEELVAIAETGGVICVTTIRWMLDTDADNKAGLDDLVSHAEYVKNLVGIDHVGIATDAYMNGWEKSSTHYACEELASYERWKFLAQRLHDKGWSDDELTKLLGGNLRRVLLGKRTARE